MPTRLRSLKHTSPRPDPDVDPCEALEKLPDVTLNPVGLRGWIVNRQPQGGWIHRKGVHPVIEGLSLALEVRATSAGFFGYHGMAKWMVCTPLCSPSPVYYHHTNVFDSSLAPPPTSQRSHSSATLGPRLPSARLDYHLSELSCHLHRPTTPPGTARGVQVDASRCGRRRGETNRQRWLCVGAFCEIQVRGSDGKRVKCQGTREGKGCVDLGVVVFGIKLMGVLLLLYTPNRAN